MIKHFIGIDVGKQGAIVVLNHDGTIDTYPMPLLYKTSEYDTLEFFNILKKYSTKDSVVGFEDLHSVYNASAKSNFEFGKGNMLVEAVSTVAGFSYTKIQAKKWQKLCFEGVRHIEKTAKVGFGSTDTKAMATIAATRLFPNQPLNFGGRAKKPNSGLVDALLIAYYLKQTRK